MAAIPGLAVVPAGSSTRRDSWDLPASCCKRRHGRRHAHIQHHSTRRWTVHGTATACCDRSSHMTAGRPRPHAGCSRSAARDAPVVRMHACLQCARPGTRPRSPTPLHARCFAHDSPCGPQTSARVIRVANGQLSWRWDWKSACPPPRCVCVCA